MNGRYYQGKRMLSLNHRDWRTSSIFDMVVGIIGVEYQSVNVCETLLWHAIFFSPLYIPRVKAQIARSKQGQVA